MTDAERWRAVEGRDAESSFVYGVATTRIYCRPSCPSRRPRQVNVCYFDSPQEAERAGFRPCRRCSPAAKTEPRAGLVRDLCRYLEANGDRRVSLEELSEFASVSPFHLHRQFRAELGITPQQYQATLRTRQSVEPGETLTYAFFDSPIGPGLVAASAAGICAVSFGLDRAALLAWLRSELPDACLQAGELTDAAAEVISAIETGRSNMPLDIRGTAFQRKVWEALRAIPRGETRTYQELASAAGYTSAVRATGTACGANRIAVLIPCHRALRKDGSLGGYRWGLDRKAELIRREEK